MRFDFETGAWEDALLDEVDAARDRLERFEEALNEHANRLRRHAQGIDALIQTAQNAVNQARREMAELMEWAASLNEQISTDDGARDVQAQAARLSEPDIAPSSVQCLCPGSVD